MEKTEKRELIKLATSTIVAIGTDAIIAGIANAVLPNAGKLMKFCSFAAAVVIGGCVNEIIVPKTDTMVDEVFKAFDTGKALCDEVMTAATNEVTVK